MICHDQKFKLEAAFGSRAVNVNVLFADENNQLAFRQAEPEWDVVKKIWIYENSVPILQFNDITMPKEKTFTTEQQNKEYIRAKDCKGSGTNSITCRVPPKLTRL